MFYLLFSAFHFIKSLPHTSLQALLLLTYRQHTAYTSHFTIIQRLLLPLTSFLLPKKVLSHFSLTAYFCSIIC
nr:MAG TPA: hypothetical protein [Caudoviricetes sp.]